MKTAGRTLLFAALLSVFVTLACGDADAAERRVLFDEGWRFHRGSVANAEQPEYNDSRWRTLDVPHDWSVEPAPIQVEGVTIGPFSRVSEGGMRGA